MESRTFLSGSPSLLLTREMFVRPMARIAPLAERLAIKVGNSSIVGSDGAGFAAFATMTWRSSAIMSSPAFQRRVATDDSALNGIVRSHSSTDVYGVGLRDMSGAGSGYQVASVRDSGSDVRAQVEREFIVAVFVVRPMLPYIPGYDRVEPPVGVDTPTFPAPQSPTPTTPTAPIAPTPNTTTTTAGSSTTTTTAGTSRVSSAPAAIATPAQVSDATTLRSREMIDTGAMDALAARLGSNAASDGSARTTGTRVSATAGLASAARIATAAVVSELSRSTIPFEGGAADGLFSMQAPASLKSAVVNAIAAPAAAVPAAVDAAVHLIPSSPRRVFEFAQLGSPFALLADSVAGFVEDSASLPRASVESQRHVAWLITATVVAADAVLLTYAHRKSKKLRTARAAVLAR
jgi:hypothetical protein